MPSAELQRAVSGVAAAAVVLMRTLALPQVTTGPARARQVLVDGLLEQHQAIEYVTSLGLIPGPDATLVARGGPVDTSTAYPTVLAGVAAVLAIAVQRWAVAVPTGDTAEARTRLAGHAALAGQRSVAVRICWSLSLAGRLDAVGGPLFDAPAALGAFASPDAFVRVEQP